MRPVVLHPDPVLREVSAPVVTFDAGLRMLVADMFATMYAAPGRGLAAVQIGVLTRVFVLDATWKEGAPDPKVFVNPTITGRSAEHAVMEEGCLSIPDTPWRVARPAWIDAAWQGLDG
ncbi:MAG: peptide deformylase, partial [Shimia sp.]